MGYTKEAFTGAGWMSALRVITRGLGFIKVVILARLLTPEDFGLFGIAALTIALLETFTEPGINIALIQQDEEIDEYISTAWIISVVRGIVISFFMFISARMIAEFFKQPTAADIVIVASAIPLVRGFLNPAAINFIKKLQFQKEFILRSTAVSFDIASSIVLAIILRSPIAIIYGMLIGAFAEVILTYTMLSLRPGLKISLDQIKKLMDFGKWVNVGRIMSYLNEQLDDILVGRLLGAASLGIYQMAFKLSVLPSIELSEVISKVIFPVYTKIYQDTDRLRRAVIRTTGVLGLFSIPIALLSMLFPESIIRIILGEQWLAASTSLKILALYGFLRAITQAPSAMLFAIGKPDIQAKIGTFKLIIMTLLLFPLINKFQIIGAAWAVVISALLIQPFFWLNALRIFKPARKYTKTDQNSL